ncbi:ornithine cyclodeaminase family protein [Oceanibium sediminis]|uniref:ornithine cyclodeaminase family protein n=1 Tax=Oceanibium sediminis TaxID=2026339 RepID=UPI000DD480F6|nr:ornithine cyclodeaminase family protein [Oceanibium sediminis]
MATTHIPHLAEADLDALGISAQDSIAMLEHLIRGTTRNEVWGGPKSVITPPDGRYMMATFSAMSDPPLVATKSLVLNPRNSDIGLPQINGLVTLLDGTTGLPLATVDGNWVTAVRTAALSALAAKYMANPQAESVGFVGTGTQARSHLDAYMDMFPLKRIKISGRGRPNIDALIVHADSHGLTAEVCDTPKDALSDVDLAVTTVTHTGVSGPFLDAAWLGAGCFVSVVDLAAPWHKDTFAGLDRLVIDDLAQEETLPVKLADPKDVDGDLTGLVMGTITGRSAPDERTAFVFRGLGLGDLALAALAWQKSPLGRG